MQYFTLALFAAPLLASPTPMGSNDMAQRDAPKCQVNAKGVDVWHKNGLQRRRTAFSFVKGESTIAPSLKQFADHFRENAQLSNGASGIDWWENDDGSGELDASFVLGLGGDHAYERSRSLALKLWIKETGCCTGAGCTGED